MRPPKPLLDPALAQAPAASSSRRRPRSPKKSARLAPKQPTQPAALPDPSSGILALLVTVAGSSSVAAHPLDPLDSHVPPEFLCPRLHAWSLSEPSSSSSAAQQSHSWYWEPCDASEAASYVDLSSRRRKRRTRLTSNNIADKYTQGPDGRWRKADSWELYGSSSCSPTEFPVQDDQVTPTSSGSVTATSSVSSSPSLPPGWDKDKVDDDMTGMILGLSLSLAVALTVFMMGIVRWRQKRQARAEKDTEGTPSVFGGESLEESEELKRARTQQRLWARASAKWVANVRQSARRRRKRMAATAKDSDGRLLRDPQGSLSSVSLTHTTTAHDFDNRASSPSSLRSSRRSIVSRSPSPTPSDRHRPSSSSHHPPAYLQSSSSAFQYAYPRWNSHPLDTTPDSHHASRLPPPPESPPPCSADRSPPPPLSPLPYEPPAHSAHVAVDDKAVLARLVHLASAPPALAGDDRSASPALRPGRSSEMEPSVPVLDDDPYECVPPDIEYDSDAPPSGVRSDRRPGLASQAHDGGTHTFPPHGLAPQLLPSVPIELDALRAADADEDDEDGVVPSYAEDVLRHRPLLLPPPPAKVPLTGPMFYEYPNDFERDVVSVDPPEEPSAPPFEDPSSPPLEPDAPPLDAGVPDATHAHMMAPSAPPLEYAFEEPVGTEAHAPSAPSLEYEDEDEAYPALPAQSSASASVHHGDRPPEAHARPPSPDDQGSVNAHVTASSAPGARAPSRVSGTTDAAPPRYLP
ncbi:hypothetical protein TRAPUB_683 [Trametes pubescens]|uniref:Uncharacterized protein n=1 Tax=Trametes pubescens TaxID=154538 RepID=A0A1M2VLR9_TRAPU|nr:hypothetical protein TRAPUB_683 [Trametes pubescens]